MNRKQRARNPAETTTADGIILQAKIEKLLEHDKGYAHDTERWVVALVLLTRLEPQRGTRILLLHPELIHVCELILSQQPNKNNTSTVVYSRLVAQVISATCDKNKKDDSSPTASSIHDHASPPTTRDHLPQLGKLLLQLLEKVSGPFLALDVDIVTALSAWLPSCEDLVMLDNLLFQLWQRAAHVFGHHIDESVLKTPVTTNVKHLDNEENPSSPEELLGVTLTAILNQNSVWTSDMTNDDECSNLEWWELQLGTLFVEQGRRVSSETAIAAKTPSFLVPLLEWWLQRRNDKKSSKNYPSPSESPITPTPWPQVLLLCLQHSVHTLHNLVTDADLSNKIIQLLLACMVTTTTDDNLRGQAWFTLSTLVQAIGWDWMLVGKAHSNLGRASKLCAILRMAAGEYKIQLNHHLYGVAGVHRQVDRDNLVDECGRFLALSLDFVSQMADRHDNDDDDEEDENRVRLSNSAVLHIRKSLHEALTCSAHYCSELTSFDAAFDLSVLRLFGALLSEFDIFLDHRNDEEDEHAILSAIRVILTVVRDQEAYESLLPGLLMIFASSEGDETRVAVLKPYLSDFVSFFDFWWSSTNHQAQEAWSRTNVDMIECGWSVLELWHDMVVQTGVVVEVGGIQREILQFLTTTMNRMSDSEDENRTVKAIASAVSSYMALQGDEAPGEPDSSIIRRAVDFLQSSRVAS